MTKTLTSTFLATAILFGSVSLGHSEEQILKAVNSLPDSVTAVQKGGYWELNGSEGNYRAVVVCGGMEHVRCDLYIQWLEAGEPVSKIISTVKVKEIEKDTYSFETGSWLLSPSGTSFSLPAQHTHSMKKGTITLKLGIPGKYEAKVVGF